MKEKIKTIIESYCQGTEWLEFNISDLDKMTDEIIELKLQENNDEYLKVGDKIDIGGFITEIKKIEYDYYYKCVLFWFYNEKGEYKFNVREGIKKITK